MADEPRRVRTQAERDADDHAWRAVAASRPGYATYPQTAPGSPSWWRREFGIPPDITVDRPPYEATLADAQDAISRVLAEHLPALGQALTEILAQPRRRWWHRYTRRAL